jgi:hypothetical protein
MSFARSDLASAAVSNRFHPLFIYSQITFPIAALDILVTNLGLVAHISLLGVLSELFLQELVAKTH